MSIKDIKFYSPIFYLDYIAGVNRESMACAASAPGESLAPPAPLAHSFSFDGDERSIFSQFLFLERR